MLCCVLLYTQAERGLLSNEEVGSSDITYRRCYSVGV